VKDELETVHGSGNVFRDFGHPDADIRRAKAIPAARIVGIFDDRALSIRKAEKVTGFAAADFSRIRNADYGRFTLDRLIRILNALDATLEITVDVHPRTAA
jgi:predicted XRE-type DNA-binding protein